MSPFFKKKQVILDEFVKPNKPVSDYRTDVTGLTAQDLETASTLSVADLQVLYTNLFLFLFLLYILHLLILMSNHFSQEKVGKFLSWNTFMVGHFLNHDLNGTYNKYAPTFLFFFLSLY